MTMTFKLMLGGEADVIFIYLLRLKFAVGAERNTNKMQGPINPANTTEIPPLSLTIGSVRRRIAKDFMTEKAGVPIRTI